MSLEHAHEIKWLDLKKIKLNKNNTNTHSEEQIERLAKIIKYQGWRWPIIIANKIGSEEINIVAAGEGRYLAAKKLGLTKVPVSYQEFDDWDQFNSFTTSDNAIASWSEIDLSLVNSQLENFDPSFDLDLLGIKDFVLEPAEKNVDKPVDKLLITIECKDQEQQMDLFIELNSRGVICKASS